MMSSLSLVCGGQYSFTNEDKDDYRRGWSSPDNSSTSAHPAYTYNSRSSLPYWPRHAIYSGGGYVVELKGSLSELNVITSELEEHHWLDGYTRAIFIDFSIYNAQVNLFTVVNYILESPGTSGLFPTERIYPVNLLVYQTSAMAFQVVCQFIYILFILYYSVMLFINICCKKPEVRRNEKPGVFWLLVDFLIVSLSYASIAMYVYCLLETKCLLKVFKESHGNAYVSFQFISYWHECLMICIGFLVFLATIKFLRILRFHRSISQLASTLKYASKALVNFTFLFLIIFIAFAFFFYLHYNEKLSSFSSAITSVETSLQMVLGKFDFYGMRSTSAVFGPLFFFLYQEIVGLILLCMFVSILDDAFTAVRINDANQLDDYQMVDYLIEK